MNYRDKLYSEYVSTHTSQLYGEADSKAIKKQFPIWKKYYSRSLNVSKESTILDIGCGNGSFVYWLQKMGYKNASGIDISSEQITHAKRLNIENVFQADLVEYLKTKKGVYDLIYARDVIEHFNKNEVLSILEIIYKSLFKTGILVLYTPNAGSPFYGRYGFGDFTHENRFTSDSLHQILSITEFKNIRFYSTGPVPKGIKSLIRYLLWKPIELILRLYLLIETGSGRGILTQTLIGIAEK